MNHKRSREQGGFTLIEILVGMIIISLAIMALSAALRQVYLWQYKQRAYENLFITAQSLLNLVVSEENSVDIEAKTSDSGELNGFNYSWDCTPLKILNNYQYSIEQVFESGNTGVYRVALQSCLLELSGEQIVREFSFYRTQFCCRNDEKPSGAF